MQLRPLRVRVSAKVQKRIKDLAKLTFPKECFAYLLGVESGQTINISDLYIPNDLIKYTTPTSVQPQAHWISEALGYAYEEDLDVIGHVHSHPYTKIWLQHGIPDHSLSEADLKTFDACIQGICRVLEGKSGRLRASTVFWGPMVPVEVEKLQV